MALAEVAVRCESMLVPLCMTITCFKLGPCGLETHSFVHGGLVRAAFLSLNRPSDIIIDAIPFNNAVLPPARTRSRPEAGPDRQDTPAACFFRVLLCSAVRWRSVVVAKRSKGAEKRGWRHFEPGNKLMKSEQDCCNHLTYQCFRKCAQQPSQRPHLAAVDVCESNKATMNTRTSQGIFRSR